MRDHDNDIVIGDTDGTFILDDYVSGDTITVDVSSISGLTTNTTTLDWESVEPYSITLNEPVEFEDNMPNVAKVEDMCNDYPALRKAYENFKTIYAMVHQDWQGRQDDDDALPF